MRKSRTARETEVKLRVPDFAALIQKIRKLGAKCDGRVFERNTLWDTPEGDFQRRESLLRLRIEIPAPTERLRGGRRRALVTLKAPVPVLGRRYKEKLEREGNVEWHEHWPTMLRALGFREGFIYEKYRTPFRLPELHLDLDETPIGTFLELEGNPARIDKAAEKLGFSHRDYSRATYWDLFQAHRRSRRRADRNMRFHTRKIE